MSVGWKEMKRLRRKGRDEKEKRKREGCESSVGGMRCQIDWPEK